MRERERERIEEGLSKSDRGRRHIYDEERQRGKEREKGEWKVYVGERERARGTERERRSIQVREQESKRERERERRSNQDRFFLVTLDFIQKMRSKYL